MTTRKLILMMCVMAVALNLNSLIRYRFIKPDKTLDIDSLNRQIEWMEYTLQPKKHSIYSTVPTKEQIGEGGIVWYQADLTEAVTMYFMVNNVIGTK